MSTRKPEPARQVLLRARRYRLRKLWQKRNQTDNLFRIKLEQYFKEKHLRVTEFVQLESFLKSNRGEECGGLDGWWVTWAKGGAPSHVEFATERNDDGIRIQLVRPIWFKEKS